jgi:hypothetical protein
MGFGWSSLKTSDDLPVQPNIENKLDNKRKQISREHWSEDEEEEDDYQQSTKRLKAEVNEEILYVSTIMIVLKLRKLVRNIQ